MSKYFNSIVTCHRSRRLALRAFLKAFSLAAPYVGKDTFEIVITDMDESSDSLISRYSDILNINLCKVKYDGPFCRAKALNHAVLNAQGKYVTPIDIDAIVTKHFLPHISDFYSQIETKESKLCHRIRSLDVSTSCHFWFSNFDEKAVDLLVESHDKFPINRERYTEKEVVYTGGDIKESWMDGAALGTSQFTMLRDIFMLLGGYDENFIGRGCQDLDFNLRAFRFMGGGYLGPDPKFSLYHLANSNNPKDYATNEIMKNNYDRYISNKQNNVISIPISSTWGIF